MHSAVILLEWFMAGDWIHLQIYPCAKKALFFFNKPNETKSKPHLARQRKNDWCPLDSRSNCMSPVKRARWHFKLYFNLQETASLFVQYVLPNRNLLNFRTHLWSRYRHTTSKQIAAGCLVGCHFSEVELMNRPNIRQCISMALLHVVCLSQHFNLFTLIYSISLNIHQFPLLSFIICHCSFFYHLPHFTTDCISLVTF